MFRFQILPWLQLAPPNFGRWPHVRGRHGVAGEVPTEAHLQKRIRRRATLGVGAQSNNALQVPILGVARGYNILHSRLQVAKGGESCSPCSTKSIMAPPHGWRSSSAQTKFQSSASYTRINHIASEAPRTS